MTRYRRSILLAATFLVLGGTFLSGCSRGLPRDERPVVIIPDMEVQKKFRSQGETPFFEDGRMTRMPPAGTVPRGGLRENSIFFAGKIDTNFVAVSPVPRDLDSIRRGRERFNIFCSPCHDQTGGGRGMIVQRGLVPPPALYDPRIVAKPDGEIFDNITHGIRNMPGYKGQIPTEDRWAIVAYVRALQRAQNATLADVPPSQRGELR